MSSYEWLMNKRRQQRVQSEMQIAQQMQLLLNDDGTTVLGLGGEDPIVVVSSLVLFYDFKTTGASPGYSLSYPGTGTTITDIQGSSDASMFNTPLYRDYETGYMEFNGSNQYILTTDSLVEVPTDIQTISAWVYPRDNGVILSERGLSSLSSGWHDAQMNMVGGTAKFGMWSGSGIVAITSSVGTPLKNWYHFAMIYDGSTLTAYVNGATAGSATFARENPIENGTGLFYALGAGDTTSMGDTSYQSMKLGSFKVWNVTKTYDDILAEYNERKTDYSAGAVVTNRVLNADFGDFDSYPGSGTTVTDLSSGGNNITLSSALAGSIYGAYRTFNGSSDYGTLTRPVGDTFTLNCWFKTTQNAGVAGQWYQGMGLMDCEVGGPSNDFGLTIGAGKVMFGIGNADTTIISPLTYNDGNWHNACATRNKTTGEIILYVDGVQVATGTAGTQSLTGATNMGIGRLQTALNYFSGNIGLCQAYTVILNSTQVLQNYDAYKTRYGI